MPTISVFGSAAPLPNTADYEAARTVGRLLAQAGFAVQTGGYSGVMAAASQGAAEAGDKANDINLFYTIHRKYMPPFADDTTAAIHLFHLQGEGFSRIKIY